MKRAVLLLWSVALPAAALDPRFSWQTLTTPHFEVHYHQGMYLYAQKVARAAELSHDRLAPLLDHLPQERTQIVVEDDTDFVNGNASPLLYDLIHAYAAPPDSRSTLADFDDNVYELVSHEYTHILHLDTVLGLPALANSIFGKLWITNGGQPLWFIEGIATFAESEVSASGRVRSSEEDMILRGEVLSGNLPRIDVLSNVPLEWPRGFGQYTVGSRFLEWIREQYGLGALRDLSHDFGGRAIPFALNLSAQRVVGKSYLELYDEFGKAELALAERLRAEVQARGETRIEPLTNLGEWTRTPRFSADGATLYYANAGPDRLAEVRALPLGRCCGVSRAMISPVLRGDRHVATIRAGGPDTGLAIAPSGRVLFAQAQIYQEFEELQDIYSADPRSGDTARVTRGLRARGIDVAKDGALVFVWRRPGGRTAIAELAPGAAEPRIVFADEGGEPVDSPRVSPDGGRIAFLHHRNGAWDLRIVSRDGRMVSDVTHDRALDRDPAWTSDGRWLLFSSDRTGIYDIYAWRAGELRQVTDVVLGAFEPEPSPDGTQLALVTYSSRGYDLGRMPLDPSSWRIVRSPPAAERRPAPAEIPAEQVFPSRPYSAAATLRPHFWLPFAGVDAYGTTIGALTAGFDAVDRHEYAATAWWSLFGKEPGWDVFYIGHSFYPTLALELSRDLSGAPAAGPGGGRGVYIERATGGTVTVTFPFTQVERGQSLALRYDLFRLSVDQSLGAATSPGTLAQATLTYSYSDARRFVRSISTEEGQRFTTSVRLSDPGLGSAFRFWQAATALSEYVPMPWSAAGRPLHHVIALRGSGGISRGDLSNRHQYSLGGFQQQNLLQNLVSPTALDPAGRVLRGFRAGAFRGDAFVLGSAEYRFPLLDVERGAWTLPLYLRRLHGALYADVGDAFTPGSRDFRLHAGAGGELRAEMVLGWILPIDFRFGCARGLESSPAAALDCYGAVGGIF